LNTKLEEKKLALNQSLESTKNDLAARTQEETNRFEVNKLFLGHYQNASATVQRHTIDILVTLYPEQFVSVAKIFHTAAQTPQIRDEIQRAASAAAETGKFLASGLTALNASSSDVATLEGQAFTALVSGDIVNAKKLFLKAYDIFPTYHNVDEISHIVLTTQVVSEYSTADSAGRSRLLKQILRTVIHDYSWGSSPALLNQMQSKAR